MQAVPQPKARGRLRRFFLLGALFEVFLIFLAYLLPESSPLTPSMAKTRGMDDRFIANHPFIFLIRDNATGQILFLGRIVDPTK